MALLAGSGDGYLGPWERENRKVTFRLHKALIYKKKHEKNRYLYSRFLSSPLPRPQSCLMNNVCYLLPTI